MTLDCGAGPLVPGEARACTVSGVSTVTAADERAGAVHDTAVARAVDPDGGAVRSPQDETSTPARMPEAALHLVKEVVSVEDANGSGIPDVGDLVTYRVTVTNTGNVPVADVRVDDPRLAGDRARRTPSPRGAGMTCTADGYTMTAPGAQQVEGTVTNGGDDASDSVVTVSWIDDTSDVRARGIAVVEDVARATPHPSPWRLRSRRASPPARSTCCAAPSPPRADPAVRRSGGGADGCGGLP